MRRGKPGFACGRAKHSENSKQAAACAGRSTKECCMVRKSLLFSVLLLLLCAGTAVAAPPGDFTVLAKNAGPAVVNINTEKVVTTQRSPFPFSGPFEEFFRGMPGMPDMFERYNQVPQQRKQRSLGSGFVISADGFIVTNHHVVDGADSIQVSFDGPGDKEVTYKAELIGSDQLTDLAILKIKAEKLPFLKFGDSDAVSVGEWVVAIGNPFGLDHTVTAGIISAKGRSIRSNPFDSFLQTDASINPGNSGGPLLNMKGEVVGVNAAILANGQGIGFAIPSNMANEIIEKLRTDRKVSRGWIGVTIQSVDAQTAKALGLPNTQGALIGDVMPGHPADKASLKPGDVILAVNGEDIVDSNDLSRKIAAVNPGEIAKLTVWRNGAKKDFGVTVAERDTEIAQAKNSQSGEKNNDVEALLGMSVRPVATEDLRRLRMDLVQGLVVTGVENGKNADDANLRPGDVILSANGESVNSVEKFLKILSTQGKSRGAIMLYVNRQGAKFFRTVEVATK